MVILHNARKFLLVPCYQSFKIAILRFKSSKLVILYSPNNYNSKK